MGTRKERLEGIRANQKVTRQKNRSRKAKARVRRQARQEQRAAALKKALGK